MFKDLWDRIKAEPQSGSGRAPSLLGSVPGRSSAQASRTCIGQERRKNFVRRSNFALRVPPTLPAEARKAADSEGVVLNQLITLARCRTSEYFAERARRVTRKGQQILARVGKRMHPL